MKSLKKQSPGLAVRGEKCGACWRLPRVVAVYHGYGGKVPMYCTTQIASGRISFTEIVSLGGRKDFGVIIRAYVDDSSDEKQKVAISAGAFIGKFGEWCDVKTKWVRRLKRDGLKYFRTTEYHSLQGEFRRYRDPQKYPKPSGSIAAKALRHDLEAIICNSKLIGVAVVIPLDLYWNIRASCDAAKQIFPPDPFEMAIQSLFDQCVKDSIAKLDGTHLAFFCDDGPNSARVYQIFHAYKSINPNGNELLGSFVHQDDKKFPPLQVADLMAHLGRECYMTRTAPKGIASSIEWIKVWNEEYMRELLEHERKRRKI